MKRLFISNSLSKMISNDKYKPNTLLITLGSNYEAESNLSYALDRIYEYLYLIDQTAIVETEPIDFPYPSASFYNTVLLCRTYLSLEDVQHFLEELETACGRNTICRELHPDRIPLDADLIIWESKILKPKDLSRPYLSDGLLSLSIPIDHLLLNGLQGYQRITI